MKLKYKQTTLRMTDVQYARLQVVAAQEQKALGECIRDAISFYLAEKGKGDVAIASKSS